MLLIYVVINMILELWKFFVFSTVNKTRSVMWPTKNFMLYLVYCFMNCIDFRNKVCCEKKNCFTIYDFSDSLVLSPNPNKKFIIHFSSFLRYRQWISEGGYRSSPSNHNCLRFYKKWNKKNCCAISW